MRKRALLITPSFGVAQDDMWSIGARALGLATHLAESGQVVNVLCPSGGIETSSSLRLIVDDLGWKMPELNGTLLPRPAYALGMRRGFHAARELVMRLQPHLVIALGVFPSGALAHQIHDLYGVPYVLLELGSLRGYRGLSYRSLARRIAESAELRGVSSPWQRGDLLKLGIEAQWMPGALSPLPEPMSARRFLALGNEPRTARAFELLAREVSNVSVTWVNGRPKEAGRNYLNREAHASGQADPRRLAERHDIVVLDQTLSVDVTRGLALDLGLPSVGPQIDGLDGIFHAAYRPRSNVSLVGRLRQAAHGTLDLDAGPQKRLIHSAAIIQGLLDRIRT